MDREDLIWEPGDYEIVRGGTTTVREAEWPLREYSDEEPRDYHGRWTSDGGGAAGDSAVLRTDPAAFGGTGITSLPTNPVGLYTDAQRQDTQRAVEDAVKLHPELATGPHPWAGVGYASNAEPPSGVSTADWQNAREQIAKDQAEGTTWGLTGGVRTYTILNDVKGFDPGSPPWAFPSESTLYGVTMHEAGHAWMAANGVGTSAQAKALLDTVGIGPLDIARDGSKYGAADPREGIAELFSMRYTPGYSVPADLAPQFEQLLRDVTTPMGTYQASVDAGAINPADVRPHRFVVSGPLRAAVEAAATKNLEVNAWVAASPELDRVAMREARWPLREYSDDEPRDEKGEWTTGGGGSLTSAEHTTPTMGSPGDFRSAFSPEDRQGVQQALSDAVAKYPELGNSNAGRPFLGIAYLSSGLPVGPDNSYDRAVYDGLASQMRESGADGITGGATVGGPTMTVLDDISPHANDPVGWSFDTSTYGLASHEIGHAWADANGVVSDGDAAQILRAASIKPSDLAPYSQYGMSGGQEAIAELFSASMRPDGVPASLTSRWDTLSNLIETHGGAPDGSRAAHVPASAPAASAVRDAAAINTKADDWVTSWSDRFRRVREAYSPDEARDDHGRWTSGGGGGADEMQTPGGPSASGSGEGALASAAGGPAARIVGMPNVTASAWSPHDYSQVHAAVNDALAAHPDLAPDQPNGLQSVDFASSTIVPEGFTQATWSGDHNSAAELFRHDASGVTYSEPEWGGSRIVLNDMQPFSGGDPGVVAPASGSGPYGMTTHEIGHAWADAHGVIYDAGPTLMQAATDSGVSRQDFLDGMMRLSNYGATSPDEGFAELFAQENVPGYSLPAGLQGVWDTAKGAVMARGTPPIPSDARFLRPVIFTDPKIVAEIKQAAKINTEAGDYVAPTPLYDKAVGITTEDRRRMRESTARLREYSDSEPRDGHGRWTSGGGESELWQAPSGPAGKIMTAPAERGGGDAVWSKAQYDQVGASVNATLAKNPELATGPNPLKSVSFVSASTPPDGMSADEWARAQDTLYQLDAPAITYATPEWGGSRIVLNDSISFPKYGGEENPPGWSVVHNVGDVVVHEMGHAWATSHGLTDSTDATDNAGQELEKFGLAPFGLRSFSEYAAGAGPNEAMAELFAGANIPGRLPSGLAASWSNLYQDVEAHGFPPIADAPSGSTRPFVVTNPRVIAELQHAASINANANTWIAPTPLYDAMLERGRLREAWPLREDYSPDEPRDEHGRWSSGGTGGVVDAASAGGGTIDPATGEQPTTGYAVALEGHSSITPAKDFFAGPAGQEAGRQITKDWLAQNAHLFDDPEMHIGVWYDTAHQEIVLDPSQVVQDRGAAIALGQERDQQAIWDLGKSQEISTGGSGGRGG